MRLRRTLLVLLCAGLVLCAWPVLAQEQTGSIQGVVRDTSGGVLPGVTVEARSPSVVGVSTAVTDGEGVYRFPALPPGTYIVSADLPGFMPGKVENVVLSLGQLLRVNLTLAVGGVAETVQVTGESPLIDVKQNAAFATIQEDLISRIPKGRDFTDVIRTAPGAQEEGRAGGTQIDGASGSENRFIIDGMDTTNLQNGVSGKTMLIDFIQEVQVKSSGYNAEFGGATGGVVSAITKSGSNRFRGSAGLYEENTRFRGSLEKRPSYGYSPWNSTVTQSGLISDESPWQYYSAVGDVGGPIFRDRMWYYGGIAYTRNDYTRDAKFINEPGHPTRTYEWGSWAYYPNYNVTTQLNSSMRLRVSGSNQRNRSRGTAPSLQPVNRVFDGTVPSSGCNSRAWADMPGTVLKGYTSSTIDLFAYPNCTINEEAMVRRYSNSGSDSRNDVVSGNLDWIITPKFFINSTAGYFRTNQWVPEEWGGTSIRHSFSSANSDSEMLKYGYPTVPAAYQQASGFSDTIASRVMMWNIYTRLYANVNATYFKSLAGQHIFKAGMRFERFGNDINNAYNYPNVSVYWGRERNALDGRVVSGTYGYYMVNKTGTVGKVNSNNYSFWLQDSWTVRSNLTINAGIRAENEMVPSYKSTADAIDLKFGFADKIAPRLGFAYDVLGDGKWKAYGSYGWFYDITKLEMPRGLFGGDHWINYYWTLDTYDWASIQCDEGPTGCPGTFIEEWDARRSTNQPDPILEAHFGVPGLTGIDPNIKPVRTGEFTVGLDRELNRTMSFGVRYVHKWMTRTIEDVGLLIPGVGEVYIISNPGFGYSENIEPDWPQYKTPKAQRDYDGVEFRLRKRFADRWQADVSYTYSRLWGNYGGLASSDEGGRTSPNVNRYFDNLYMSYDSRNQAVFGLLQTDRPHVVKVQATYDLPWGTSVGAYAVVQSGLPDSTRVSYAGYPIYLYGRTDMDRLPTYKMVDLNIQHDLRLGGNRRLTLQANIDNPFDLAGYTSYYTTLLYRSSVTPPNAKETFFGAPWDINAIVADRRAAGLTILDQDFYGVLSGRQGRRTVRFNMKFSF